MKKNLYLSPNYSKKIRSVKNIKFVIIHYTGMQSEIESIKRLMDKKSKVSCHYLINRRGRVLGMVPDRRIAWHAGKSRWMNFKNLNNCSIGIELVNKGHQFGYQNFTSSQIASLRMKPGAVSGKPVLNKNILDPFKTEALIKDFDNENIDTILKSNDLE